jgi:hypothetical protein
MVRSYSHEDYMLIVSVCDKPTFGDNHLLVESLRPGR